MTRYAPNEARPVAGKVALVDKYSSNMVSSWVDYIELRRTVGATFSVWARKQFDSLDTGRPRWSDWESTTGLKSPQEVMEAIELQADEFCVTLDWEEAVRSISSIDWVTAAVIAKHRDMSAPELPALEELRSQRRLRTLGSVELGLDWGGSMHKLSMPFEQWLQILLRQPYSTSQPCEHNGAPVIATWTFDRYRNLQIDCSGEGHSPAPSWSGSLDALSLASGFEVDDIDIAQLALEAPDPRRIPAKGPVGKGGESALVFGQAAR